MKRRHGLLAIRRKHCLSPNSYPTGLPVHVTICAHQARPVFRDVRLAAPIFSIVADHSQTVACCLMPDHLHWLIADAESMGDLVRSFKSYTTYAARTLGHGEKLWQKSYWDHVLRREEDVGEIAEYIIHNPVRGGIVSEAGEYPYQIVKL